MRHRVAGKRLNRSSGNRKALRRNLVTALLHHERIETTAAKAKAIRGQAEKLITLAKRGLVAEQEDPARSRPGISPAGRCGHAAHQQGCLDAKSSHRLYCTELHHPRPDTV